MCARGKGALVVPNRGTHSPEAGRPMGTTDRAAFAAARRIVIKVGTSTLTHRDGRLNEQYVGELARQIRQVKPDHDVVLVTSGAIRAGMERLGLKRRPKSIASLQANAAVGQGLLMQVYHQAFYWHGMTVAQVLLTREGLAQRSGYLNACRAFAALFEYGVVPIVNENDTVAVEDIRFGDNDMLAALVACAVSADLLLILSDVDGLHEVDAESGAITDRLIREVPVLSAEVLRHGKDSTTLAGTGGMVSKLHAAQRATRAGAAVVIAHGKENDVIPRVVSGECLGTRFAPDPNGLRSRKRWVAFAPVAVGTIVVNAGAKESLTRRNSSLLPVGVVRVDGEFAAGDLVAIADESGWEIGRGLSAFSSAEVERVKGHHSHDIAGLLGAGRGDVVVHRDNLVVGDFEE